MKHNYEIINLIIEGKNAGYSSRAIADVLGIGKSTVNDIYNRYKDEKAGPKIAILDTETSAVLSWHFDRWNINIGDNNVQVEGGNVMVASHKWFGEDTTHAVYMTAKEIKEMDDSRLIHAMYDIYAEADAIVMHNGKKFDNKVIQTRGIYHGLGKLPTVKIIDTLQIAKKYLRLPSNRLDSIGKYFGLGRKVPNDGIALWKRVQNGDKEAMKEMVEYCVGDVNLLESVFKKLAVLGIDGFKAAQYFDDEVLRCNVCGSENITQTGRFVYTGVSKFTEHKCTDCGAVMKDRKNLHSAAKRKSLLN